MAIVVEVDRDLEEIVPTFLENRHKELGVISDAIDSKDFDSLKVIGHKLAGNAGGYGFERLGEIGAAIEEAAKKNDMETITDALNEIKKYLSEVEVRYV